MSEDPEPWEATATLTARFSDEVDAIEYAGKSGLVEYLPRY